MIEIPPRLFESRPMAKWMPQHWTGCEPASTPPSFYSWLTDWMPVWLKWVELWRSVMSC